MKTQFLKISKMQGIKEMLLFLLVLTVFSCCSKEEMELNQSPVATLTVSANGNILTGTLTGSDTDGTISKKMVEITNDAGVLVETLFLNGSISSFTSNPLDNGQYTVTGIVIDNDDAQGSQSQEVAVFVDSFAYAFDQTLSSIEENNTTALAVGELQQTGTLSFESVTLTSGEDIFEITGTTLSVKASVVLDYEIATSHSFSIRLTKAGYPNIIKSGTLTVINVVETTQNKLCGGHGKVISVSVDENTFVADASGNATSVLFSDVQTTIANNTWSSGGSNLLSLALGTQNDPVFSSFGLSYVINTGIIRPDGNSMGLSNFGRLLQSIHDYFSDPAVYGDSLLGQDNDFGGQGAANGTDHGYQWRLIFMYTVENIAKVTLASDTSLNDSAVLTGIYLDTLRSMDGIDNTQAQTLFDAFVEEDFTGGQSCD